MGARKQGIIKRVIGAIRAFGTKHFAITCVLAAAAICAMGILIAWFLSFSGMNAPTQFIYAGF